MSPCETPTYGHLPSDAALGEASDTVAVVDLGTITSSAVAAGVVSAAVNGLIIWQRSVADARERRNETRRAHLLEAVVDFLAAAEAHFRQARAHRDATDRFRRQRAKGPAGTNELGLEVYTEKVALREIATGLWGIISRMRLYSDALASPAVALLVELEPVVDRDDPVLSDEDYSEALGYALDGELEEYNRALEAFIARARAELGIAGL